MIKRSTKVTSLLVVAASIISMVPVMAADVQKVESEEGTVYSAKANADGTFFIDGELNDEDGAVYSYKDGKYTKLDNADSGDAIGDVYTYEDINYLEMADGDYYVYLETGETTDDDIKGNIDDDAASALRTKIKDDNDGRFAESTYTGNIVEADEYARATGSVDKKTLFGATGKWRQYFYNLETTNTNGDTKSTIFSDDEGNYVDADYNLGKIGVYNTTGAGVTVKNTDDTYELEVDGTTYEIKGQIQQLCTWDEGSDYITRTAALSIWGKAEDSDDYVNLTDKVYFGSSSNHHQLTTSTDYEDDRGDAVNYSSVRVFQKISKAQASDDIDGIKYANDVKTYFITDEDGNDQPILGLGDTDNADSGTYGYGLVTGGIQGYLVSVYRDYANSKQYAETLNFKGENGYNYVDVDDADSVSVESVNDDCVIGCGDVYSLSDDGYVERFIAKDSSFGKIYKVDGSMNEINVSLPNSLVVWNEDDGVYSIIAPEASSEDATATTDVVTTDGNASKAAGWVENNDGTWTYVKDDGAWYYLKADGIMATGWVNDAGTWYYLNTSGAMQTGWINDNGTWYYCNTSGAMLTNTTVDGYVLDANGAWVK